MKIAIIGAGICGLSCALEFERLGVTADVYEQDHSIGWLWPTVGFWPSVLLRDYGDIITFLREKYNISIKPLGQCKNIIMKSKNQKVEINGNLGYFLARGKGEESVENQIKSALRRTPICFNSPVDHKTLSKEYDWVIAAAGNDNIARELGVWEDKGFIRVIGGVAFGSFNADSSTIYFNTEYAGTGYARLTPFNSTQAVVALYTTLPGEFECDRLFDKFLETENLKHLGAQYRIITPPFTMGILKQYKVGNILLAGRAAGLTERLLGVGGVSAVISGILAARSVMQGLDYESRMKYLASRVESLSVYRDIVDKFGNDDFDKLLETLGKPGLKQLIYNTNIDFMENAGKILKTFMK